MGKTAEAQAGVRQSARTLRKRVAAMPSSTGKVASYPHQTKTISLVASVACRADPTVAFGKRVLRACLEEKAQRPRCIAGGISSGMQRTRDLKQAASSCKSPGLSPGHRVHYDQKIKRFPQIKRFYNRLTLAANLLLMQATFCGTSSMPTACMDECRH